MTVGRPARVPAAVAAAVGALALLAILRAGGGTGPALYDGLCLPPQYLTLGASPGPGSASATYTADQLNQTQELATTETTPQAQVVIAAGSFAVPPGASVTITIRPVPAPAVAPSPGTIAGNVYQLTARASTGQTLDLLGGHPATVVLAAPSSGGPQLSVERFDGKAWTPLKTYQSGCGNTDAVASPSLGMFALVATGASSPSPSPGPGGSGGPPVAVIVVLALVVVLGLLVVAVRVSRRRR